LMFLLGYAIGHDLDTFCRSLRNAGPATWQSRPETSGDKPLRRAA